MPLMIVVLGLGIVMLVCVVVLVALLLCNNSPDEEDCRLVIDRLLQNPFFRCISLSFSFFPFPCHSPFFHFLVILLFSSDDTGTSGLAGGMQRNPELMQVEDCNKNI